MPEIQRRFLRRTWVRRALPAGVAAVLVVAGTAVTRANANASPADSYRTGTVSTGSVEQRLNLTGAVRQVDQVSQGFAVTGTVTSVRVSVGDVVTTGQTLAVINPVPLQRAVTTAQASLAKAKATLESDQTSTAANGTGGTGSTAGTTNAAPVTPAPTATPTTSPRVATPSGRSGPGAGQTLAQAQLRVASAQKALADDLGRASAALAQCAPFFPTASTPPGAPPTSPVTPAPTTSGPGTTTGPTPTGTASAPATPSAAAISACLGALRVVPNQQQIQRDQKALTRSQTDLMTAVTLAVTTAGATKASSTTAGAGSGQTSTSRSSSASTTSQSTSASQSATTQSLTNRSSGGLSATSQSAGGLSSGSGQSSASRIVSDQAAVTSADRALSSAQADLASATLKSSSPGTVGAVTLVAGASSSGKSISIVGTGAVAVTIDVPLASIGSIKVGQKANVTPQGATTSAPGAVTSVSLLPSTSASGSSSGRTTAQTTGAGSATSGSPTYPVVVLVPDALPALASGSRADVSLLIGTVAMVLTVPNSALTPLGAGQALAVTYKDGVATRAMVKTGYTGTLLTQVISGLTAGQQVVLADLSTALPTNTTSSRRFGVGGAPAGGLGGAGLGGAGLGGGGLGGAGGGGAGLGGGGFPPRG